MEYEIALPAEGIKQHQSVAMHALIAFALIGFGIISYVFYAYSYAITESHQPLLRFRSWAIIMLVFGIFLFAVIFLHKQWLIYPKNNRIFRWLELLVSLVFIGLSYMHNEKMPATIFGILCLGIIYALIKESSTPSKPLVVLNKQGVQLPALARNRHLNWTEIEAVMLKHGTLTIECADNHFYQWNTNPINFDPNELHSFCISQIELAKPQRIKEW
jgi:hypothetical protein